jgi:hypothetical protein
MAIAINGNLWVLFVISAVDRFNKCFYRCCLHIIGGICVNLNYLTTDFRKGLPKC